MPYAPNLFTSQSYARGYPAISSALVTMLDDLLQANQTPARVHDHMPLIRGNAMTEEFKAAFLPEEGKIHFWVLIPDHSPFDKINILREENVTRQSSATLLGYYGYTDPGFTRGDLELSLPSWEAIVRLVISRLQYGDPVTGSRTLSNTCLTYKSPESVQFEMAQLSSQVTCHQITLPIQFEEAYI